MGIGLEVVDIRSTVLQAQIVAGTGTAVLKGAAVGLAMQIERINVHSSSTQASTLAVYLGAVDPKNRMDYTPNGNDAISDEASPIWVPGGVDLTLRWLGLSANDAGGQPTVAVARVQWRLVKVGAA